MGTTADGEPPGRGWPVGAAIGLLSGAVAIGAATLAAGLVGTGTSPILAVGAAAVDASPEGLKRFAIDTFGVVPPGFGIVHQVNLEYLARGIH